ncbi:NTP transferase domain-containing protein [Nocardia takedensis]
MQCVILAGGLGTRMLPYTATVPKTLLEVAGRPFAHWQLEWLAACGVDRVLYSLGHLGEAIEEQVGRRAHGLEIDYVYDGPDLLGTGGALRRAADAGALESEFLVLYGDSCLPIDIRPVWLADSEREEHALMTVYPNGDRWDRSNVVFVDGRVVLYEKNPAVRPPAMRHIDYGLSILRREVIEQRVPSGGVVDLAHLYGELSRAGLLAGFEVTTRFYEIGSPSGLRELEDAIARGACRTLLDLARV